MLQGIKIESLSGNYNRTEKMSSITVNWTKLFYIVQCVVLFALPIGAIVLSIASDYLFLKEILSATLLLVLILFVKIAGGRS